MAIIEATGLARDFTSRKRTVHAVCGVDLTVDEGEIVGFLGPNVYLVLVAVGLSSLSYATALRIKSEDAFAPLVNSVVVPLILLSGIMLPMTLGPGWLQGIARISPFRYIIDAMRNAYRGQYLNAIMLEGMAVSIAMAAVCLFAGARAFLRENA